MKSILWLAVFAAVIPFLADAQTEPKTKPAASAGQQSSAVEQELTRLDRELMDATIRKDKTVMERTAIDRYVFVNPGGGVQERGTAPEANIESAETENIVVRVDGDTAILTGRVTVKGTLATGADISGRYTYMRVFVRRRDQWRLMAMSAVPIQPQPTPMPRQSPTSTPTPMPKP